MQQSGEITPGKGDISPRKMMKFRHLWRIPQYAGCICKWSSRIRCSYPANM